MKQETAQASPRRIAFLLDNLNGGGAERVVLGIAAGFASLGYDVDLLVCELKGELCGSIPRGIEVIELQAVGKLAGLRAAIRGGGGGALRGILHWLVSARKVPRAFRYIPAITAYLRRARPAVLMPALVKSSISAVLAAAAAGVTTRIVIGIQIALSVRSGLSQQSGRGQAHSMMPLARYCFNRADRIVAASGGVARDAIAFLDLDAAKVQVVYNPVTQVPPGDGPEGAALHPWFGPTAPPVVLGIGRLVAQKNFPLLLQAFALVRRRLDARLMILGGDQSSAEQMAHRQDLLALAADLGVAGDVALPGYQGNPHAFLRAARVFALSSDYEGFGNVLVEALQAGCPVVSTDCPSGPAEILDHGRYGTLVAVGDVDGLAQALLATLGNPPDADALRQRGGEFSLPRALDGYHQAFFGARATPRSSGDDDPSPANPSSRAIRQASGHHNITHSSRGRVTI